MRNITLMVVPGDGRRTVEVRNDMTVSEFVTANNLHGRSIIVNGEPVSADKYDTYTLENAFEVFATATVKGA